MYKPKESFLKLNNQYSYMGGITPINTLKRYSTPIFETNNPPPKKVKFETIDLNEKLNDHLETIREINNSIQYNDFNKSRMMDIETTKENVLKTNISNISKNENVLGYLDGITKNIN